MKIDSTEFGSITIGGKTYEHDVLIDLSGDVSKRKKKLSKKVYGTSHTISREEAEYVYQKGCEELILGTGQFDNVRLSPEAAEYLKKKDCPVTAMPTPQAIRAYNKSKARKIGLFHVTC
jgi:hypothetical protein